MSQMNNTDKARKWFEETRKLHLGTPNPDIHKVIAGYKKSLEFNPNDPAAVYHLGLAYLGHREFSNAEERFREAIRLQPTMAEAWYHLGQTLLQLRRADEAEVALRKSVDNTPPEKRAPLYFAMASAQAAQHDQLRQSDATAAERKLKEAEECYRLGLEINPEDPNARFQFALFLQNLSQLPGHQAALDEAEEILDDLLAKMPMHRDVLNLRALLHSRRGQFEDAIACLQKALEGNEKDAGILFNLGQMLEQAGRQDEAKQRIEESLEVQPRQPGALSRLAGIVAQHDKDYDKALEYLNKGLELAPGDPMLGYQKALIFTEQAAVLEGDAREKLENEARVLVEDSLKKQPGFAAARALQARLAGEPIPQSQPGAAPQADIDELKRQLEEKPEDSKLRRQLLDAFLRSRRFDEALPLLEGLLEEFPDDPGLRINHGLVLSWTAGQDMSRVRQARESLRQGLAAVDERDSTILLRLIQLDVMLREPEEAADLLDELEDRAPDDQRIDLAQVQQLRGVCAQQKGFHDEAGKSFARTLELLEERLTAQPGNAMLENARREAAGSLAHNLELQGLNAEAIDAYRSWHKLAQGDGNILFRLANLLNRERRHEEALGELRKLEALNADNAVTHFYIALTLIDLGKPEEAESCLMKALELKPDFPEAQQRLQHLQQNRPLVAASLDELKKAVEDDPEDMDDRLLLAQACLNAKDWDGAIEHYNVVVEKVPENHRALFDLSNAHVAKGDMDKAIESMILLEERLPGDPNIRFRLAELLLENGEEDLAVKEYRNAVEMQPNNAVFQFRYGVALKEADKEDRAEEAIRRALELQKTFPLAHYELGLLEYTSDRHDAALKSFTTAFQQDQRSFMALYYSGLIMQNVRKNAAEAAKFFQSVLSISPAHGDSHFQLGRIFKDTGRKEDAVRHLKLAIEHWPEEAFNREAAEGMLAELGTTAE
jgi:tetratricopeptide (TPR) repeat protein